MLFDLVIYTYIQIVAGLAYHNKIYRAINLDLSTSNLHARKLTWYEKITENDDINGEMILKYLQISVDATNDP